MAAPPHDVQLPFQPRIKKTSTVEAAGSSPASRIYPAELLLMVAKFTEGTEDLQRIRLVSRAFSHAATTALQDRFTRIYVLPLQSSMARFTNLIMNPLIGPKITRVDVMYGPPVKVFDIPQACAEVAMYHRVQQQTFNDIMSEYNDKYTDSRPFDDSSTFKTVVDSGEFERVLGEGLRRLPELRNVTMSESFFGMIGGTSPSLNLPNFLHLHVDTSGGRGSGGYDAVQNMTVRDYVKLGILQCLYRSSIGQNSPIEVLGTLSQWPVAPGGRHRALSLFVPGLSSVDETAWTTRLARQPRLLHNTMANLTDIELSINCPKPHQTLAARLDNSGVEHHEISLGQRWHTLLKAATNLKALRLRDTSAWSAGFDNLLRLIFRTSRWPKLTELSIRRGRNIGLLPFAPHLFEYSLGWYLFLQRDLDAFLVRHKKTLEKLVLRNIIGLRERFPPAPISWQWLQPGFPNDPKPSLGAFERSLKVWKRELMELKEADVVVAVEFYGSVREAAIVRWLEGSEIQVLASAMDVGSPVGFAVASQDLVDSWGDSSRVEFDWGGWLSDREG